MEDTRAAKKDDTKKKKSESSSYNQDQDPANLNSLKPVKSGMKPGNVEDESSKPSTWKPKDLSNTKNDELELAKVEMGEVMQENKRLKSDLDRMMKDYQALQMRFHEIARQESKSPLGNVGKTSIMNNQAITQELADDSHELSLSLGRNSSLDSKNRDEKNKNKNLLEVRPQETLKESSGLSLVLDYTREGGSKTSMEQAAPVQNSSTDNSIDEPKDETGETWPPSKVLKTMKSGGGGGRDDEVVQQPPAKKARVSVRARCDTPTMNDGCQWRKYGQKIAKGNPCPRAYYRCTVAPSCPVRKQVQRCADDMSILITTYEGTHNHSLPISATAMASTTSAAAYMLISGSSTNSGLGSTCSATTNTTTSTNFPNNSVSNFPGLNFNFSDTSRSRPLFLPNSSFSPSPSQPTITLDLTTSSTSSTSTSQFSKLAPTNFAPRSYPTTTNLTFNSLDLSNPNPSGSTLAMSWTPNGQLSYTTTTKHVTYNKTQVVSPTPTTLGVMSALSRDQDSFYQTLLQKINPSPNPNHVPTPNSSNKQSQQPSLDTVAAAARAITSDPSFQSVLTAALSSLMGGNNNVNGTTTGIVGAGGKAGVPNVGDNCHTSDFTHKVKWGNQSPTSTPSLLQAAADSGAKTGNGCASSFLSIAPNNTPNSQAGNLMLLSSPLPFSTSSKSTSTSPEASRDQIN